MKKFLKQINTETKTVDDEDGNGGAFYERTTFGQWRQTGGWAKAVAGVAGCGGVSRVGSCGFGGGAIPSGGGGFPIDRSSVEFTDDVAADDGRGDQS